MRRVDTELDGVWLIEPERHHDERGMVCELGRSRAFGAEFAQINLCHSVAGALRGLHWQVGDEQGKLVYPVRGRVRDVAVDLRRDHGQFGRHIAVELSAEEGHGIWLSPGFAHGFLALEDALVIYALTAPFDPDAQRGVRYSDPTLAIAWGVSDALTLSPRDRALPLLRDIGDADLPHGR